ncbi:hypothetical protein [Pseudomonas syringae group genomosp. 7]
MAGYGSTKTAGHKIILTAVYVSTHMARVGSVLIA